MLLNNTSATRQGLRFRILVWCLSMYCFGHVHALEADVRVSRFQTPEKAYAEIFTYILGSSVTAYGKDSSQTASVNVTYFISRDGQIIAGDKFNLISHGTGKIDDFMDLRRVSLDAGMYHLSIEFTDNHDTSNVATLTRDFEIASASRSLAQSDILLLSHIDASSEDGVWKRNGYTLTPLPYNWYRAGFENLYFYAEIYNSDVYPATDFYLEYSIHAAGDSGQTLLKGYKRLKPKQVNSIIQAIDISGLSSGEYLFAVNVFDQAKTKLSTSRTEFIRSNPAADMLWAQSIGTFFDQSFTQTMGPDSVRYALKALAPKISQIQTPVLNYLLEKGTVENQRRFLHQYWTEANLESPEIAYREYMVLAAAVDKEYHSAFGYGFETDRGHIMLKYGFPDDIIAVDDEPSAPPYEIWFYNDFPVTSQSDVRFLFYNPSLAGGDYRLLHSTAVGEVQNSRWQLMLYSDAITEPSPGDFIDGNDIGENFHRRAAEYFND